MVIKYVDPSGSEIILSLRVFAPKPGIWSWVFPIKSHEGVATKAVGENCHCIGGVSKLYPHAEHSLVPKVLFVKENSTFKCLESRDVLIEFIVYERVGIEL